MSENCMVCSQRIPEERGGIRGRLRVKYCSVECLQASHRGGSKTLSDEWGVSTSGVGAITELVVAIDLMKRGYDVFKALSMGTCDLVAIKDGKCLRVEVKSGYIGIDGRLNHTRISHPDAFELLAIATKDSVTYRPEL